MRKLKQYDALVIAEFEDTEFRLPLHTHTYYELIYIVSGEGTHRLNQNEIPYRAGDLFMLSPGDEHYFEIVDPTRFIYIKFTEHYFHSRMHHFPHALTAIDPLDMMRYRLFKECKLRIEEPYKTILGSTVRNIATYSVQKDVIHSPVIFYQVLSIFGLIREAMESGNIHPGDSYPDRDQLVTYIHQHIYEPGKIKMKEISAHFNIAHSYFSAFFKRNMGVSYREYTDKLRASLVEKRIVQGKMTLKQVADEFGFTDESHVSNYFRKKKAVNPRAYQKMLMDQPAR